MKNSTQKTLEKTEIHHNLLRNMEICKNMEESHVWGSFLDNSEWLFFIKLWWQKKVIFIQMHNTILQSNVISKCKNDNLEKI